MQAVMRAAIYARVSTEEQANEGFSIRAQQAALLLRAEKEGFLVVEEYIEEGASGKNISGRPQMVRLLNDAENQKFDVVLIAKLDRLTRSSKDSLEIAEMLSKKGIQLISLAESIDTTTPHGKMFYTVLSSINQMEREQIAERVKTGMTQRAKEGKWNGGVCFGYDVQDKKLLINEHEAEVVREIFRYGDCGFGYKRIVGILNRKGYRTKRGQDFSTGTVKGILDNPVYAGKIRFNQHEHWAEKRRAGKNKAPILVDGQHEQIITSELWERVQLKRKERSFKPVQSSQPFILTKLLRCPQCGAGMVSGKSKTATKIYRYYHCGTFHNKGASVCSANSINADKAEQQVLDEFKRIVTNSDFLKRLVDKLNNERLNAKEPLIAELKRLTTEIAQKKQRIETITEKLIKDPELLATFSEKLKADHSRKLVLERQLETIEKKLATTSTTPIDLMALRYLVANIDNVLEQAEAEEKKELLRLIIQDINIAPSAPSRRAGRHVTQINLKFDFTPDGIKKKSKDLLLKFGKYSQDNMIDLSALNKSKFH